MEIIIVLIVISVTSGFWFVLNGKTIIEKALKIKADQVSKFLATVELAAVEQGMTQNVEITPKKLSTLNSIGVPPINAGKTILFHSSEKEIACYPSGVCSPATIVLRTHEAECKVILSLRGRVSIKCETN